MTTIVHLLPHFDNDGNGIVNIVVDLACAQAATGHTISCIGRRSGSYSDLLRTHGVATRILIGRNWALRLGQLYLLLNGLRPEIVHAHTVPTALLARALQAIFGFRLITTVHNGPRLRNVLLGFSDRIICVSDAIAEEMKRLRFSDSKIRVVRNGPLGSLRRPSLSGNSQNRISRPAIVTLGSLHHYKGVQDVISAFSIARKSIPNLSLYILGEGPMKTRLKKQSARIGANDTIHFKGFIADPRPYLAQADVFILPSHREAFGIALAEAREAGCAIVGTNVGGIPEVLEGGRSGVLVPSNSPKDIAQVVVELLSDPIQHATLKRRAGTNLQWLRVERMSQETINIYGEALSPATSRL
jgi:glycosyltransferase involved in cell wall biosynthesis